MASSGLAAAISLSGCSLLPGSSDAEPTATTVTLVFLDPATFEAQGTRETWCAIAADGVAHPLGDKSIFLGDAEPMRAAFDQENLILVGLEPSVPPELASDYVSAVNGTKEMEAAMVAANYDFADVGTEFNVADDQLTRAWNAMNGYSQSQCG